MISLIMPLVVAYTAEKYAVSKVDKLTSQQKKEVAQTLKQEEEKNKIFTRKNRLIMSAMVGVYLAYRKGKK